MKYCRWRKIKGNNVLMTWDNLADLTKVLYGNKNIDVAAYTKILKNLYVILSNVYSMPGAANVLINFGINNREDFLRIALKLKETSSSYMFFPAMYTAVHQIGEENKNSTEGCIWV